jgi:hypothetical protein
MPLLYTDADFLQSPAQVLAFGHNARARPELGELETRLFYAFPSAFAAYQRQARRGTLQGGSIWWWHQPDCRLAFLIVRDSSVGATRLRHVQNVLLSLMREHSLLNLQSIAIAPLGSPQERPEIDRLLEVWLQPAPFHVWLHR